MTETGSVQPRHPFVEMTITRLLVMVREPEMIFWVFVFPLLMALALGIAFRSPSEARVAVAVEPGVGAAELVDILAAHENVEIVPVDPGATETALRDGLAHVAVVPGDPPRYRYDPTRPESRLARQTVDDLLQRAAGRKDVWTGRDEAVTATGSRYIDWLIPGLLGMNIMGTGMWGVGFTLVVQRTRKLLKRLIATPMRRHQYLAALVAARLVLLGLEVAALVGFARLIFGVPIEGSLVTLGAVSLLGAMTFQRDRTADGQPRADDRGRVRHHERRHGADVDLLRDLLRRVELPGPAPAVHSGTAAHRAGRCAAKRHARRERPARDRPGTAHPRGLVRRELRPGAQDIQVALGQAAGLRASVCRVGVTRVNPGTTP